MHSLQKTWPLRQQRGSIKGLRQRQHASKGLIESLPKRSFCVPYPSFLFSSYVKNARSLLFFECLWGILASSKTMNLTLDRDRRNRETRRNNDDDTGRQKKVRIGIDRNQRSDRMRLIRRGATWASSKAQIYSDSGLFCTSYHKRQKKNIIIFPLLKKKIHVTT